MRIQILSFLAASVLFGMAAQRADARFVVSIDDGSGAGIDLVIEDNGGGDTSGISGVIQTSTATVGDFSVVLTTSRSKGVVGSAQFPVINMLISANYTDTTVTTTDNTLRIVAYDTDFGDTQVPMVGTLMLNSSFLTSGLTLFANAGINLENDDLDSSDTVATILASMETTLYTPDLKIPDIGIGPLDNAEGVSPYSADSAYAIGVRTMVTGTAGAVNQSTSYDVTFSAVPEPASMALLATALPFGGLALRRRRKTQLSA